MHPKALSVRVFDKVVEDLRARLWPHKLAGGCAAAGSTSGVDLRLYRRVGHNRLWYVPVPCVSDPVVPSSTWLELAECC